MQQLVGRMQDSSTMAMDAHRRGDSPFVHFNLPGVDADSIEVTAEQNTLTVRADDDGRPSQMTRSSLRNEPKASSIDS
jgi:HSP20 family protein